MVLLTRFHRPQGATPFQTLEGREQRAMHTLLDLCALPLADAGAAGISKDCAANLGEDLQQAIPLNGGTDLLRARGDGEGHLGLDASCQSLLGH